jgi:hypothetical protein
VLRGDPTTNSEGWTARRACRRGGLPAAGGGGRRELCCGAAEARTGQGGLRVAVLGGQGYVCVQHLFAGDFERGARRDVVHGGLWRAACGRMVGSRFSSMGGSCLSDEGTPS